MISLALTAGMFFYNRPAEPRLYALRDAPNSGPARGELPAAALSHSLAGVKPAAVLAADEKPPGPELATFEDAGEAAVGPAKPVSWLGQRCFDTGCLGWASNTGLVWSGEQCAAGGCLKWTSSSGVIWSGSRCRDAGCQGWTASNGGTWNGEQCGAGGCLKWTSDSGRIFKGQRCYDAGCMAWTSNTELAWTGEQCAGGGCLKWTANAGDEQFLPFLNKK